MSEGLKRRQGGGVLQQGGDDLKPAMASRGATENSQHQQQRHQQHQQSAFLPEPFPTAARSDSKTHLHDAFGEDDSGVDYGPPIEYEDEDEEDDNEDELIAPGGNTTLNEAISVSKGGELGEVPKQSDAFVTASGSKVKTVETNDLLDAANNGATNNNHTIIIQRSVTIEELEEEVGLHETTLESLNAKLQKLNNEIEKEKNNSSSLQSDMQLLGQRKMIFRKRTDNNLKLVKDLELSLEKCLERLRRALDAVNGDNHDTALTITGVPVSVLEGDSAAVNADGDIPLLGQEENLQESNAAEKCDNSSGFSSAPVDADMVVAKGSEVDALFNVQLMKMPAREQLYSYEEVPLNAEHEIRGRISWPTPKLVRKIQHEVLTLPVDIPTWRTQPLSMSLLGGLDSEKLIVDMMNVAVLEHLLEREGRCDEVSVGVGELRLSNQYGWVKETDIWGTSLDVCSHVSWKHLYSGFRRVDENKGEQMQSSSSSPENIDATNAMIDPNVIVCPYELGGTCADDQCPYQHLKKGNDDNRDKTKLVISLSDGSCEGYVRYNNIPKPKLPRSFLRDDFIIARADSQNEGMGSQPSESLPQLTLSSSDRPNKGGGGDQLAPNNINSVNNIQGHQTDNRHYHCPICVDQKTYNGEELQAHMKQCNPSSIIANNRSITIQHVLLNYEERCDDASLSTKESKNSAVRDSSTDSEDEPMSSEKIDDTRIASYKSVGAGNSDDENANDESENQVQISSVPTDVEENLDYVSLPSVFADNIDGDSNHGSCDDVGALGDEKTIFDGIWWHQIDLLPSAPFDIVESCHDSFDSLLLAFGFERLRNNGEEGRSHSLRYTMVSPANIGESTREQIENLLLFSRLIDLCRLLVHMGRDSFALSAINSICESKQNDPYSALVEGVSWAIKTLSYSRCAYAIFQVQAHLLVVSESLHAQYDYLSLCGENTTGNSRVCLDTLLDQIAHLNCTEWFAKKNLLPAGFDTLRQSLMAHTRPKTDSKDEQDEWAAFAKMLRLMIEKFVVVPYSQLEKSQQILFLLQSICIGQCLGHLVCNASRKVTFGSYLHALEPIWSSLQHILQASSQCKGWLQPDIIAIVIIGPCILRCVTDTVASSCEATSLQKLPPKFDPRALANMSSLENFIMGIIKDLNRFGKRSNCRFIEPMLAPFYSISATICIALGSFEKAHLRLEQVLNKEVISKTRKHPSMYALSEMIWSQLVQIRMFCPSYSSIPLKIARSADEIPSTVPDEIYETHCEIASRIVENGVFLWGLQLRGDSHMNIISPCLNGAHCKEWEKAAAQIFADHPLVEKNDCKIEKEKTLSSVEFCISDPYPEMDGVNGRVSVFPLSPLLLGKALIRLSLKKCGLSKLPLSMGHHLANLQFLDLSNNCFYELPGSISHMTHLEVLNVSHNQLKLLPKLIHCSNLRVIDVSHNQLTSFPADLALQCSNLQSFLVEGNPASDILAPSQKRQKIRKFVDDS